MCVARSGRAGFKPHSSEALNSVFPQPVSHVLRETLVAGILLFCRRCDGRLHRVPLNQQP